MKFIDLFAGLGGFHVALSELGHECVFASEKDIRLRVLYEANFGIACNGDIKKVDVKDIPQFDILCAGFPCQPFSKAGKQLGLSDIGRGDLIFDILRILAHHKPQYFILENVPNLKKHDREQTWSFVQESLHVLGYDVKEKILSPHQYGIPQIRNRIFIVGSLGVDSLRNYEFPLPTILPAADVRNILDINPPEAKPLTDLQLECLTLWQKFIEAIPLNQRVPSFPLWGMEVGANYPLGANSPYYMSKEELGNYNGAFGQSLKGLSKEEQLRLLPSYARYDEATLPEWKIRFITTIRAFLENCSPTLIDLLMQFQKFPPSWQKLEWNCLDGERNIFNYLIQFRASGIRVKRTNYTPALVLNSTQIPIIGWEGRYLTLREAARLQLLDRIELPETTAHAYRSLGNAVNVRIVSVIAKSLLNVVMVNNIHQVAV